MYQGPEKRSGGTAPPPSPACRKCVRVLPGGVTVKPRRTQSHCDGQGTPPSFPFRSWLSGGLGERGEHETTVTAVKAALLPLGPSRSGGSIVRLASFAWGGEAGFVHSKHRGATGARQQRPAAGPACAAQGPLTPGLRTGLPPPPQETGTCQDSG